MKCKTDRIKRDEKCREKEKERLRERVKDSTHKCRWNKSNTDTENGR